MSTGTSASARPAVDNCYLLATSIGEFTFMITGLTNLLRDRHSWFWKPSSLEAVLVNIPFLGDRFSVLTGSGTLQYSVKSYMIALGGLLDAALPDRDVAVMSGASPE